MKPKAPYANCTDCTLKKRPFVPTYAPDDVMLAVVGEAPGFKEAQKGVPFVGDSGRLLQQVVEHEDVSYEHVWRSNMVACQPYGNRDPKPEEVECCAPRLVHELEQLPPVPLIPVGAVATKYLTGENAKQTVLRGRWREWRGRPVLPTWHPAYVLRFPGAIKDLRKDIHRAIHGTPAHPLGEPPEYQTVYDILSLERALQPPLGSRVAFDIETTWFNWYPKGGKPADRVLMLGVCWGKGEDRNIIIPSWLWRYPRAKRVLNELFARKDLTFIAQNGKFDDIFLRGEGVKTRVDFDTLLAKYTLWEMGGYGLEAMALEYFGLEDYKKSILGPHLKKKNTPYSEIPFPVLAQYCAWDTYVTWWLSQDLEEELREAGLYAWPFKSVIMRSQRALTETEYRGVKIDVPYLQGWDTSFAGFADTLEKRMQELAEKADLNPRSWKQVSEIIYKKERLPHSTSRKVKRGSTSVEALAHIAPGRNDFIDHLRAYRRVHKIHSSYITNLLAAVDPAERAHANIRIQGTVIGRLAFRDPALQTIPRDSRDALGAVVRSSCVAAPGNVLIIADYSQAELRIAGALSMEPFLLKAYQEGRDVHWEVAHGIWGDTATKEDRAEAKRFNFAYIYGGTEYSFAEQVGMPLERAREWVRRYQKLMSTLTQWKEDVFLLARKQGYVESIFGRRRRYPLITRENLKDVKKTAPHFLVASPANDLTLLSLCQLEERGWPTVLTVHDSILLEVPEEQAEACAKETKEVMLNTAREWFPQVKWDVDVDISDRWGILPDNDSVRQAFWQDIRTD